VYINSYYSNPYAHTSQDILAHIDPVLLGKVAAAVSATTLSLANEP
jgi:hypothetical protein